jgi:recombinational DNA repair protein RecT
VSNQRRNNKQDDRSKEPNFNVQREQQLLLAALNEPLTVQEYKSLLGPDVDYERFESSAIDAIMQNWKLCNPAEGFRKSLFFSLKKAEKQGLEPDGSQGVLVPRYNSDAKCELVQWQPMVKGVQIAGKRAGILASLNAQFVLAGEPFRYLSGDDERIEHEWKPDIREKAYSLLRQVRRAEPDPNAPPDQGASTVIAKDLDAFWDMVVAAYCIVTTPDGTKNRRVMPRTRLLLVRDAARARGFSPWFGPFFDEMIVKTAIHWTFKRIPVDATDPERLAKIARFRDALEQDTEAEFDDEDGRTIDHDPPPPAMTALPAPNLGDKLSRFENQTEDQREPVRRGEADRQDQPQDQCQERRQEPQDQQQSQQGQTDNRDQGQHPADQQDNGAGQSRDPNLSVEERAHQAAKDFAAQMIGEIGRSSKHELDQMLGAPPHVQGNAAISRRMDKLKVGYPDLFDQIVFARSAREEQLRKAA